MPFRSTYHVRPVDSRVLNCLCSLQTHFGYESAYSTNRKSLALYSKEIKTKQKTTLTSAFSFKAPALSSCNFQITVGEWKLLSALVWNSIKIKYSKLHSSSNLHDLRLVLPGPSKLYCFSELPSLHHFPRTWGTASGML